MWSDLINEIEQLTDVIGDGGEGRVGSLQMLLINFAHSLHALVDGLVVGVGSGLGLDAWLDKQDCVSHALVLFWFCNINININQLYFWH